MLISEPTRRRKRRLPCSAFQARDLLDPLPQRVGLDVVAEAVAGRVVGDRHVGVAAVAARRGHLGEGVAAVGEGRVGVEVAADVAELDQLRQLPFARRLQLAAALAQLRLDVGVAEPLVDLVLGLAEGDLVGLGVGDAVLGDREAALHRVLAELDVVGLGAGEVLEQVAELGGRDDAQVDRDAVVGLRADAVFARFAGGGDQRVVGEELGKLLALVGGRDQVDVLAGLGPAADRAGDLDPVGAGVLAQRLGELLGDRPHGREQQATRSRPRLAEALERGEHALLGFRPEPFDLADLLFLGGFFEVLQRGDLQLLPEQARGFRPDPGDPRHFHQVAGNFAFSFAAAGISPVSSRASIFSASVLPTPGMSVAFPARASSSTETGLSRIALAAVE